MADALKIRVSLELDAMETANDLAKQINDLNESIKMADTIITSIMKTINEDNEDNESNS